MKQECRSGARRKIQSGSRKTTGKALTNEQKAMLNERGINCVGFICIRETQAEMQVVRRGERPLTIQKSFEEQQRWGR